MDKTGSRKVEGKEAQMPPYSTSGQTHFANPQALLRWKTTLNEGE